MLTQKKLNEKYRKKAEAIQKQRNKHNFNYSFVENKIPNDIKDYSEVKRLKRRSV